jgi:hypothetical protein
MVELKDGSTAKNRTRTVTNVAGGADRVDIRLADSSGDRLAGVACHPTSSFCL